MWLDFGNRVFKELIKATEIIRGGFPSYQLGFTYKYPYGKTREGGSPAQAREEHPHLVLVPKLGLLVYACFGMPSWNN